MPTIRVENKMRGQKDKITEGSAGEKESNQKKKEKY